MLAVYPVGKVDFLTIYPLSFEEFLINTNNTLLIDKIRECFKSNQAMPKLIHKQALELYYDYLSIGGMPEVVIEYINTNSTINAIDYQKDIIESYKNDITKYSEPSNAPKIIATNTIFGDSINWLVNAGIVNECIRRIRLFQTLDVPLYAAFCINKNSLDEIN